MRRGGEGRGGEGSGEEGSEGREEGYHHHARISVWTVSLGASKKFAWGTVPPVAPLLAHRFFLSPWCGMHL